jgi:purine catabolism regulator
VLTVASLLADLGLRAEVEADDDEQQIRWVHISELEDPTPFLSGGELLLSTGINLSSPSQQRKLIELLAGRGAAGLGFGTGFDHAELPEALIEAARERGLPLFEVPYEMPFIAITEKAFTRLVNEQFSVLEQGIEVHARLEGLVLAERGLGDVMGAIAEAVDGAVLLLDDRGREITRHPQERGLSQDAAASIRAEVAERSAAGRQASFIAEQGPLAGRAVAVPVPIGGTGSRGHWLVAARRTGQVGDLEQLIVRQAAMVVALELMRERAVRETERRLAGDVLAEALGGNLGADEIRGRLVPFGIGGKVAVLLFDLDGTPADAEGLGAALRGSGVPSLIAVNGAAGRPLLCAVRPRPRRART